MNELFRQFFDFGVDRRTFNYPWNSSQQGDDTDLSLPTINPKHEQYDCCNIRDHPFALENIFKSLEANLFRSFGIKESIFQPPNFPGKSEREFDSRNSLSVVPSPRDHMLKYPEIKQEENVKIDKDLDGVDDNSVKDLFRQATGGFNQPNFMYRSITIRSTTKADGTFEETRTMTDMDNVETRVRRLTPDGHEEETITHRKPELNEGKDFHLSENIFGLFKGFF